ncbi:MAG: hypothetical protein WC789_07125 [Lentisphaeria bacterium]
MLNDQEFSCIPTPTEKALISGAVTTLPALVANTPSTVEKAALPGLIANGPTAGEKASFANIPSAGEKAGLVNLPSAGEKAALPNIPSAADKAFLARQQGILPVCLPIYQNMSAAGLCALADWADGALVLAAQPDVPRNVTIALTDADNSCTGLITVTGVDHQGRAVVETMSPDGAGGGKALVGTKIFARVTSVVISGAAGFAPGDQVSCGFGLKFGIPFDLSAGAEVLHAYVEGVRQAGPTITTGVSLSGIVLAGDPAILPGFLLLFIKPA